MTPRELIDVSPFRLVRERVEEGAAYIERLVADTKNVEIWNRLRYLGAKSIHREPRQVKDVATRIIDDIIVNGVVLPVLEGRLKQRDVIALLLNPVQLTLVARERERRERGTKIFELPVRRRAAARTLEADLGGETESAAPGIRVIPMTDPDRWQVSIDTPIEGSGFDDVSERLGLRCWTALAELGLRREDSGEELPSSLVILFKKTVAGVDRAYALVAVPNAGRDLEARLEPVSWRRLEAEGRLRPAWLRGALEGALTNMVGDTRQEETVVERTRTALGLA